MQMENEENRPFSNTPSEVLRFLKSAVVCRSIHPKDMMLADKTSNAAATHYFSVGRSAMVCVQAALVARLAYPGGDKPVTTILDYGCGHGRVARFLRWGFPNASIVGTDYDPSCAAWCEETLGYQHTDDNYRGPFDLIWAGSVFTHLSREHTISYMNDILTRLAAGGIIVFTTQGRYAAKRTSVYLDGPDNFPHARYNLPPVKAREIIEAFNTTGYGYTDYVGQNGYGVALGSEEFYTSEIYKIGDFVKILFMERGWDNHQDVLAFMHIPLLAQGKGPYYG